MPGLSQLQKLLKDTENLGNELDVRSASGTMLPPWKIPPDVKDIDDSDDFAAGMPDTVGGAQRLNLDDDGIDDIDDADDVDGVADADIDVDSAIPEDTGSSLDDIAPGDVDISDTATDDASIDSTGIDDFSVPDIAPESSALDIDLNLDDLITDDIGDDVFADLDNLGGEMSGTPPPATPDSEPPSAPDIDATGAIDAGEMPDFPDLGGIDSPTIDSADTETGDAPATDGDFSGDFSIGDSALDIAPQGGEDAAEDPFTAPDDFAIPAAPTEPPTEAEPESVTPAPEAGINLDALSEKITDSDDPFAALVNELDDKELNIPPPQEQQDDAASLPDIPDVSLGEKGAGVQLDDVQLDDFTTPPGTIPVNAEAPSPAAAKIVSEQNTDVKLTDEDYERFEKNLSVYPLNLRLVIEKTLLDEGVKSSVIQDILNRIVKKQGARDLASFLSKITGELISIPSNYEKRTLDEYSLYKQSLEYQLKNRIIPGAVITLILLVTGFGLFLAGRFLVYEPLKAESLYKQGYALIGENMFEQSEEKFNQALTYKVRKPWFFKYAEAYRDKRQFLRAENMYKLTLGYFPHDKEAGLAWAHMELDDLANYERAEEIVRRQVLDFHINDSDALILLGDIFLEWGTELDPAKLEDARETYSTLIELKGANNENLSRMMRYFIRTDNLREVLPLKNFFYEQKKMPLGAEDLTELSGYLMEKLYDELAPNDEYLRPLISDVRDLLNMAHEAGPDIPEAAYNFGRYFLNSSSKTNAMTLLKESLGLFEKAKIKNKRRVLRHINAHRLVGELYLDTKNYIEAQKSFAQGIERFETAVIERGLLSDKNVGLLYEDMGNIDYFVTGSYDNALVSYENAVVNHNDTPPVRYKIGYIQYNREDYENAMWSFTEAEKGLPTDDNLLFALANTYAQRDDNYAAEGYYSSLLSKLDFEKERFGVLFPQIQAEHGALVELYMKGANNAGVVMHRIAQTRGDSKKNAESIVRLSDSLRAWDALTRNQETMIRVSGANGNNLAERNIAYITNPFAEYEPQIYPDIPRTLVDEEFP